MDQEGQPNPQQNINLEGVLAVNRTAFHAQKGKATKSELLKVLNMQCSLFLIVVAYYVPPDRMANLQFLRDVVRGHKKLIKLNLVKFLIGLEKYNELTLANLLETARAEVPSLFDYIPDDYVIPRLCREYVLNVTCAYLLGDEHAGKRHRGQAQAGCHQPGQGDAQPEQG